jgi:hypothetical protein
MKLPDLYNAKARIAPVIAVIALPAVSVCLFVKPSLDSSWLAPPIVLASLWTLVSVLGRSRGKALEKKLFEKWGGSPTLQMMRFRSTGIPHVQLAAIHKHFCRECHVQVPDKKLEESMPLESDAIYEAITAQLRDVTRDRMEFPLVFDELCNYGFVRNLYGLRHFGIALGIIAATVIGCWFTWINPSNAEPRVIAIGMNCLSSIVWMFWPTEATLRQIADSYAQKLIYAGVQLTKHNQKLVHESSILLP